MTLLKVCQMHKSILLGSRVLFSRREFSTLTGLSLRTIAKLIASRELKSIRVGRRRLIPRAELDQFITRDHRLSVPPTAALRRRSENRKARKAAKKRKSWKTPRKPNRPSAQKSRVRKGRKPVTKRRRQSTRRRFLIPKTRRQSVSHRKARAALGAMRRLGLSLNKAAKQEHIKPQTVLRHVGKALYRNGPGKPWKATKNDRLPEKVMVLTKQGPILTVVRSSIERTRLSRYYVVLRKWRAAEDGAAEELLEFEGLKVAGHVLITDPDTLIRLEEAGQLDFDAFYYSLGGGQ
jgi:excisionase family DNA binding protein